MELRPTEAPPKPQTEPLHSPVHRRDSSARDETWFAAPIIAVVAVLCCAGPVLLAVLAATGVGAWLLAHGYVIGAAAVAFVALLAWAIRARLSRG